MARFLFKFYYAFVFVFVILDAFINQRTKAAQMAKVGCLYLKRPGFDPQVARSNFLFYCYSCITDPMRLSHMRPGYIASISQWINGAIQSEGPGDVGLLWSSIHVQHLI